MSTLDDLFDSYNPDDDENEPEEQRCKHCGKRGLYFEFRDRRWILVDDEGNAHAPHCKGHEAKVSEFPMLEGGA